MKRNFLNSVKEEEEINRLELNRLELNEERRGDEKEIPNSVKEEKD